MEDSSDSDRERDRYMTQPYEYQTKLLFYYLLDSKPQDAVIRLPDGTYIRITYGEKFRLSREKYNELLGLTDNLKHINDETYNFADKHKGYDEEVDIVLPRRDGILIDDSPFLNFDSLYQMVPGKYFQESTIKSFYKTIFDSPSDVFKGKRGLWSKLSIPLKKLNNGRIVPWTGQLNAYGVLIL